MDDVEAPHETAMMKNRVKLVEKISLKGSLLWDYLIQEKVLDTFVKQKIEVLSTDSGTDFHKAIFCMHWLQLNNTESEQIALLLDHLAKRPKSDFDKFCRCLCLTNQKHIVEELLQIPSGSGAEYRDSSEGGLENTFPDTCNA
jgi:hypothetical protein